MAETVIKIENLKKQYHLGAIGGTTLRAELQSWWARRRGQEDPNSLIGQQAVNPNETFWALNGINLEVHKGETLGIIGTNGAGKSTLLKLLSRVTAPTEGDIWVKGRISSMLEVGTGFHGELTGRENIYMNGAILGMSKKEVDAKLKDIIEFSECARFIDTPVKRYSSGMYVKLAFAVAAHLDSEILVMDEVLAVGDMKFQNKCLGKMENVADKEGKTVLYVSHNMNTIRQLCSRCIVLNQGTVIYDGDVERAIDIYMNQDVGELSAVYNFDDVKRPSIEHGSHLFVHSFVFHGREKAIYTAGEKMQFQIDWSSDMDIKDVRMYLVIMYADSTVAGMAESVIIGHAKKGEHQTFLLEYDPSNLVEGRYYFEVDIYSKNEYGTFTSYDHPSKKVFFEITSTNEINWQRKYWGNVRLNEIKLLQ